MNRTVLLELLPQIFIPQHTIQGWTSDLIPKRHKGNGRSQELLSTTIEDYEPEEYEMEEEEEEEEHEEGEENERHGGEKQTPRGSEFPKHSVGWTTNNQQLNKSLGLDTNANFENQRGDDLETTSNIHPTPEGTGLLRFIRKLTNYTRSTGASVRLKCEAEGNPPPKKITWLKNSLELKSRHPRIKIRKFENKHARKSSGKGTSRVVSQLQITNLEVLDKGFYTCQVSNRRDTIESKGVLDVRHDAELDLGVIPDFPSAFETFPDIGESGN
ncbi:unnamed protein product [Allacma fusca]|uniref:Ig-like domain-containing protein n=1 Tax=Allacma fusca TaxID=39272 RepID=A0A8J2PN50_9HEXA|nr:unnamed protein product [Allacma fusca]